MQRILLLSLACAALGACAAHHEGYIVRTVSGQKGTVAFHDNYSGNGGKVVARLDSGEQCQGQFNTIPDQVTRDWENPNEITSEDTQVGEAVLQCSANLVLRCNFARESLGKGLGRCSDNHGQTYTLDI